MEITPKSPEELQTQVANYASSKVPEIGRPDYTAADAVFRRLGRDSITLLASADSVIEPNNEDYQDYLQFLRSRGENEKTADVEEAKMLSRYGEFEQPIKSLQADIEAGIARPIGSGKRSKVYSMKVENATFAVRLVDPKYDNAARIIHGHLRGAVAGESVDGLERFVAASYETGAVISEFVPGKHMTDMSPSEIRAIPQEQIEKLVDTRIKASQQGVQFDAINSNTFYDSTTGFTDIDYSSGGKPIDKMQAFVQVFQSLSLNRAEVLADDEAKPVMAEKKLAVYDLINTYFGNNFSGSEAELVANQLQLARATEVADAKLEIWEKARASSSL